MSYHSDTKHIMLDSSFRNRLLYPNPAEFIVPFQITVGNNSLNSINPTTIQYPLYIWRFNTTPPAANATTGNYYFPTYPFSPVSGTSLLQVIGGTPSNPMLNVYINQCVELSGYYDTPNAFSSTSLSQAENIFQNVQLIVINSDGSLGKAYQITAYDPSLRVLTLLTPLDSFSTPINVVISSAPYNADILVNSTTTATITLMGYNLNIIGQNANDDGFAVTSTTPLYLWDVTQNVVLTVFLVGFFLRCSSLPPASTFNPVFLPTDLCCLYSAQPPLAIGDLLRFGNFLLLNQYLFLKFSSLGTSTTISMDQNTYTTLSLEEYISPLWSEQFIKNVSATAVASFNIDFVNLVSWFTAYDSSSLLPIPFELDTVETKNEKLWKMLGLKFTSNTASSLLSSIGNLYLASSSVTFAPSIEVTSTNNTGNVGGYTFTIPTGLYFSADQIINAVQYAIQQVYSSPIGLLSAVTSTSTGVPVSTFSFTTTSTISSSSSSSIFSLLNINVLQSPISTAVLISSETIAQNSFVAYGSVSDFQLSTSSSLVNILYPYTPGMICRVCNRNGEGNALVQVIQLSNGVLSKVSLIFPGSNYSCCVDEYVLIPLSVDYGGQNAYATTTVDYASPSWATLLVTGVKPALKLSLPSSNVSSEGLLGQFLFVMGVSPAYTTTRYNYETGEYDTATQPPLYTSFNNSIPPPTPSEPTAFTFDQSCELYGMFPIYSALDGNLLSTVGKNTIYVQVNVMTKQMYQRLVVMSNLPQNDSTDTQFVSRCTISSFKTDTCTALQYTGSTVSSNQMVCYNLRVASLVVPNQQLDLPSGGLSSSYPYMFLEIANETASSGHNRNVIYSNNPNAVFATFTCPISDVNAPTNTKFIKIFSAGHSMVKFKPNDDLRFRLFMPDGQLFNTVMEDYLPPLPPNPLLQISVVLEITRINPHAIV